MSSLAGKVAIITGASSGIGAATAVHFARQGAAVAITGRNADNLAATARQCGGEPLVIRADLGVEEDCTRIIAETVARFGKLDVLVNNAGVLEMGSIEVVPQIYPSVPQPVVQSRRRPLLGPSPG